MCSIIDYGFILQTTPAPPLEKEGTSGNHSKPIWQLADIHLMKNQTPFGDSALLFIWLIKNQWICPVYASMPLGILWGGHPLSAPTCRYATKTRSSLLGFAYVPYRTMRRAVSRCNMARFGLQNGMFRCVIHPVSQLVGYQAIGGDGIKGRL